MAGTYSDCLLLDLMRTRQRARSLQTANEKFKSKGRPTAHLCAASAGPDNPHWHLQPAGNCQPSFCRGNSESRQAHHLRNTFSMHAMERQFVETQRRCRWHECSTDVNHATVVKIACQHNELIQKEKISDETNARIRQSENLGTQVTDFVL